MSSANELTRRRLLALGGYGMVAVSLPWLPGCGGGGGSGGAPGAGGGPPATGFEGNGVAGAGSPGAPVSAAQRAAALDAVTAAIAPAAAGSRFDSVALAGQLRAMTAFQRVGISASRQNVWALFTDGRPLVVPNNLLPTGAAAGLVVPAAAPARTARALAAAPRRPAAASEDLLPSLLTQAQYRQLDMFGEVPTSAAVDAAHLCRDFVSQETLPQLRRMAVGRGFVLPASQLVEPPDRGHDNGVDGLRMLSGDGVFFLTACSAEVGADGAQQNVICVDTPATEANEARYQAELAAGLLTYAVVLRGAGGQWVPHKCLAITPAFARSNWSFPVESLAILNLTGGSILPDWAAVLSACGLKNVLTWDRPVSWRRMLAFADDLLQLLLATNNMDGNAVTQAIEPRLRCYGVGESLSYLVGRHLTDDAEGVSQANYLQASSSLEYVNTLLPTIDYVNIDEGRAVIELVGQFGHPQGAVAEARYSGSPPAAFTEPLLGRAADGPLGGIDVLQGPLWQGDLIQSSTELQALMRGGYIQVQNGGRCSNAVQITHWEIPMRAVSTITGGLTQDITATLHLRADVRGHRMAPDGARGNNRVLLPLSTTVESRADYVASGEISQTVSGVTTTITWSGGGSVGNTLGALLVVGSGLLDWSTRRMIFSLAVLGGPPHQERTVKQRGPEILSDVTVDRTVSLAAAVTGAGLLELSFDQGWVLQAGNLELATSVVELLGIRVHTTVLSWPPVTPQYAPEATVGGV